MCSQNDLRHIIALVSSKFDGKLTAHFLAICKKYKQLFKVKDLKSVRNMIAEAKVSTLHYFY